MDCVASQEVMDIEAVQDAVEISFNRISASNPSFVLPSSVHWSDDVLNTDLTQIASILDVSTSEKRRNKVSISLGQCHLLEPEKCAQGYREFTLYISDAFPVVICQTCRA